MGQFMTTRNLMFVKLCQTHSIRVEVRLRRTQWV